MSFFQEEKEFLQGASASVIIPSRQDLSLSEIFENDEVGQRDTLFFDEQLKVYAILEFPVCPEEVLRSYLSRIELRIDAWAVAVGQDDKRQSVNNEPTRDLIASESVLNLIDPVTLVKQNDDESNVSLNLVWEVYMTINKPRMKLLEPSIEFVPNAIIGPKSEAKTDGNYLEPFSTLEPNVFEPLLDLTTSERRPYLSASRLEKVLPSKPKEEMRIRFAYTASDLIKAYQAVSARLKYKFINTHSLLPTTIVSLDIEVIPIVNIAGTIEKAEISSMNGQVESLMQDFLPMSCRSKDCITFLYKLQQSQQSTPHSSMLKSATAKTPGKDIDTLSISFVVNLRLTETSVAKISMAWTTNVDFLQAFSSSIQNTQRMPRPSSQTLASNIAHSATSSLQAQISRPTFGRGSAGYPTDVLTISFIAPDIPVQVGVPFTWRVLIVNRSPKVARLTIIPLPRIQRSMNAVNQYAKRHAPKVSSSSISTHGPAIATSTSGRDSISGKPNELSTVKENNAERLTGTEIAKAHVDENILYALHHSGVVPPETELVSLTAELRIGPLDVGQCHESEIKFVALKAGAFSVDTIRVVDQVREAEEGISAPGVVTDLRELPDVIVAVGDKVGSDLASKTNGDETAETVIDEDHRSDSSTSE